MKFELKNPDLVELDKELYEFNKQYGMALNSLGRVPNLYAKDKIVEMVEGFNKRLKLIEGGSEFEQLFVSHTLKTLEVQKDYLVYFTTAENMDIDSLFSLVLGEGSFDLIKKKSEEFDYKKYWEYFLSYQDYTYRQMPYDDEGMRDKLKELLVSLKEDVMNYSEEYFQFPADYEFDLILGQPYSNQSYFHATTKRMEIAPSEFFAFKEEGEIKINLCRVIDVLFHEILGHGRHEFNSRDFPLTLKSDAINNANIISGIHHEGVAQVNSEYALDFMKKYSEKYKIEEDYIKQFELSAIGTEVSDLRILFNYFKLKNAEDNSFNVEKEFKKVTGNHGLYLIFSSGQDDSIGCIIQSKYPIGRRCIEGILDNLKEELGEEEFVKRRPVINKAISVGVWHTDVLYDFVKLYLKNN